MELVCEAALWWRSPGEVRIALWLWTGPAKPINGRGSSRGKRLVRTRRAIISLAQQHGVSYTPTANDAWARDVTRLADDNVVLDDIELLLIRPAADGASESADVQKSYVF